MYICKVQGKCVSTIKNVKLAGFSLLTMQRINKTGNPTGEIMVAADTIGCSVGEVVIAITGSTASRMLGMDCPCDMAVVGIVDTFEV